ncbi:MAG: AAA family ATPase, partial [Deltaproteobacteria bacterium]|nr:AAA family ATPase [Deltaproteobacteria bacterium]
MKSLPVQTQDFRKIIEKGQLYVDKTDLLAKLADNDALFLSRPRRFGKSLLISTLAEIFKGNQDLFAGLKILDPELGPKFEFIKYPVVTLDMSIDSYSQEALIESLLADLKLIAASHGLKLKKTTPGSALATLINHIHDDNKQKVVVLIDEYDYPVSHNIENLALAKSNSTVLSSFYASFKKLQHLLRFVFVTGVTRYAMMGLSAGFNNLTDISFDSEYASICGFTPEELDQYFSGRYPEVLKTLQTREYASPD